MDDTIHKLIQAEHIGDGLYMRDIGYAIEIAVNHHNNVVATIDLLDLDTAINYLNRVKERVNPKNEKF